MYLLYNRIKKDSTISNKNKIKLSELRSYETLCFSSLFVVHL